jgi:opacity protein-like surface antigen
MNKILVAVTALLLSFGIAKAESTATGAYVGGSLGGSPTQSTRIVTGLQGGYQVMPFARVELDYDHAWTTSKTAGNLLIADAIGQYPIPNTKVTPYMLVGAGYGFDNFGQRHSGDAHAVYNLGAGVRMAVSQSVDLDLRYRNVRNFEEHSATHRDMNLFTAGVAYNF